MFSKRDSRDFVERTRRRLAVNTACVFVYRAAVLGMLGVILGSVMCCGGSTPPPSAPEPNPLTAIREREATAIRIDACGHTGSGVILDEHHALTALHVVLGCGSYIITRSDGATFDASIEIAVDVDVARIRTVEPMIGSALSSGEGSDLKAPDGCDGEDDQRGATMRRPPILGIGVVGETVCFVASSPERGVSCGEIKTISRARGGIAHTALTVPGNSGSPLYDTSGRLLGIVITRELPPEIGGNATPLAPRPWLVESL